MIYTLYLNTNDGEKVSTPNRYSNVNWRVNWDDLFRHKNYKHSKMIVKMELSNTNDVRNLLSNGIFKDYTGYITCNLPSTNQSSFKGFQSVEYSLGGTILALFTPDKFMKYIVLKDDGTTTTSVWCNSWNINTLNTSGVECSVPTGEQIFNISFWQGGYSTDSPNYSYFDTSYIARLTFELI